MIFSSCLMSAVTLLPIFASAVRIKVDIPATNFLPNPAALPSTSKAVLSYQGQPLTAPITRSNTFVFSDVPAGSHLLSIYSRDVLFENLRIDVSEAGAVRSWQTFRGNEWSNKGEVRGSADPGDGVAVVQVRAVARKEYYQARPSFSIMSLFKNPMILIAVVTLGMVIGVPYLMENMDPEMKEEFNEMQKNNKAMTGGAANLQNLDIAEGFASWMAGSKKEPTETKTVTTGSKSAKNKR